MNFDPKALWASLQTSLVPLGGRLLGVLVVLLIAKIVAGWASKAVKVSCEKARLDETLTKFASRVASYTILVIAAVGCLGTFGIQTASFAAVLGAAGFAVGLAFQGTLSNFSSGVMLLVFRPFQVGDVVNVAGVSGKVDEIELFTTTVDTFDKRRFIIPNGSIFGSIIENVTYHQVRRVEVLVGAEYTADIDATREALLKAVKSVEAFKEDPAPAIVLDGLGDSSVNWKVRGWAHNDDFWPAREALIRAVKMHLDEAGIGIPFPQVDLHVLDLPQGSGVTVKAADG